MKERESIDLALYRLERAKTECETAEGLYKDGKLLATNNRAYYSIFYAIRAVFAMERVDFKRHKDVLAYFNQNYVKTEKFPRKIGRKIVLASRVREDSDYDEEYEPSDEITSIQIETARELIQLVDEYLKQFGNN